MADPTWAICQNCGQPFQVWGPYNDGPDCEECEHAQALDQEQQERDQNPFIDAGDASWLDFPDESY